MNTIFSSRNNILRIAVGATLFLVSTLARGQGLLDTADYRQYVIQFNSMDPETIVKAIPNVRAWDWMKKNIPLFECSSAKIEEIYYYRWWTYRKHIIKQEGYSGYVLTEFNNWVHAQSSAYSHHLSEGRWLRDQTLLDDYTLYWFGHGGDLHKYSQWSTDALYRRYLVNLDRKFIIDLLDDLIDDYKKWEKEKKLSNGLFWQYDVRDAMEESICGSETEQNIRPTINSYMAANARALAEIAKLAGRSDAASEYRSIYESLREKMIDALWDPEAKFFKVRFPNGSLCDAREAIGFIPWMFGLPGPEHADAWLQIRDPQGFLAPKGLTTAERRHPKFRTARPQGGTCEWDGAVWPFATSQTLNGLANLLRSPGTHPVDRGDYYDNLLTYATSHVREGIPHIGEYHDEVTGTWLRDEYPRSWFYNHSTFCDLVITGLAGLVPRGDDTVEVDPLVPADSLAWFALDRVPYHGRTLTILWDRNGSRYQRGTGLQVYVDDRLIAQAPTLTRVAGTISGTVGVVAGPIAANDDQALIVDLQEKFPGPPL
ncbi:MAG: hypothetical protein JXA18_14725, partial [Chitinispirillaceae bacterium]|nr:hypothetical protein [Chitinispirillaceae bacterium]